MNKASTFTRTDLEALAANGKLKIEKGIEIPPARRGRHKEFPAISNMKVGDSIFFHGKQSTGFAWLRRHFRPMVFTVRSQNGGTRMWRIK